MSFQRPSLTDLVRTAEADFEARLPGADARLPASNLNVIARVQAGGLHGLYGYLDFLSRQLMPDTAEAEYLDRWASWWGVSRVPATAAVGAVTIYGNSGVAIPIGTALQSSAGQGYVTTADVVIAGTSVAAPVAAAVPGAAGNIGAGMPLYMTSPIAGVSTTVTVVAPGILAGADVEGDQGLLASLLARVQQPPMGGSRHDYVAWVRAAVGGDAIVWVTPQGLGTGTVSVTFVGGDGAIPSQIEVDQVQSYIHDVCPVTADVIVVAPVEVLIDFDIRLSPDTAAVRAAVEEELRDLINQEAEPGGTIPLSRLDAAISSAPGQYSHVRLAPMADVTTAAGHIARLGAITWS